jgi:hypothetical protein
MQQCWLDTETLLPPFPSTSRRRVHRRGHRVEPRSQRALEPAVQDGVRAGRHALDPNLAVGRVEQREELGRAVAEILVRLARRLALGPPGGAGMGNGLERPGLIGASDRQAQRLAGAVGILDQINFFLALASWCAK